MKIVFTFLSIIALSACGTIPETPNRTGFNKDEYNKVNDNWILTAEKAKKDYHEQEQKRQEERTRKLNACNGLDTKSKPINAATLVKIQESVKEQLKDPYSAQFENIRALSDFEACQVRATGSYVEFRKNNLAFVALLQYVSSKNTLYVGHINAKNSYGGYNGFKPFVSDSISADISTGI